MSIEYNTDSGNYHFANQFTTLGEESKIKPEQIEKVKQYYIENYLQPYEAQNTTKAPTVD